MMENTEFRSIIDEILRSYSQIGGINHLNGNNLPSRESVQNIILLLKKILFPGYFSTLKLDETNLPYVIGQKILHARDELTNEIYKSITWHRKESENTAETAVASAEIRQHAYSIAVEFFKFVPELRKILKKDAIATYEGDPAAQSEPEIILAYPGFQAITVYRIAHFFYQKQVPLIPRLMTEIIHSETGIDIHPGAKIGHHFCIDHGTGVVVGETSEIGNHVKLYQGVTIGALSVTKSVAKKKRHPTIEDNVTIYARTTVLGGNTVIGKGSIIGGNVWLTHSVPPYSKIYLASDNRQVFITGEDIGD